MLSVLPLPAPLTLPFQETAEGVLGSPLICASPLPSPSLQETAEGVLGSPLICSSPLPSPYAAGDCRGCTGQPTDLLLPAPLALRCRRLPRVCWEAH